MRLTICMTPILYRVLE